MKGRRIEPLWVERAIATDASAAWSLLTDVSRWPEWGPTVTAAGLDGDAFEPGATGWVRTPVGIPLRFEITGVEEGHRWSWKVAGVPATDHRVRSVAPATCVVGLGVPLLAAPYALVCRRALTTIDRLLTGEA